MARPAARPTPSLVSGHRGFDYEELLTATRALQSGAALFATSRDPTLPMPGGAWPGTGAIARGGRDRLRASAPRSAASPSATSSSGAGADRGAERVAMVGDRIASDIEGGRRAGLETILVLTGATTREEARRPSRRPTTSSTTSPGCCGERGAPARPGAAARASPSPASSPSPSAAWSRSAPCCRCCRATCTGRSTRGNVAVGVVIGSYAVTGLLLRPFAGRFADRRGRKPTVLVGSILVAVAGFLYLLPLGVAGLIVARLVLGAGEGTVFTAGSAWIVDLAPPERRGRVIGLYGLAVWAGLSVGPLIGELLLHASGYTAVWIFAGAAPLVGALIAPRLPDPFHAAPQRRTSTTR